MIYFYNTFHNGDVHYSRTFVRDIMTKIGNLDYRNYLGGYISGSDYVNDYCYLHNNNPQILKDFPTLKHDNSFSQFDNWQLVSKYPISYYDQIIYNNDNLYINTWVGQQNWITRNGVDRNRNDRYCSLYSHYELYEDIFYKLGIPIEKIDYYLPVIDFNLIEKDNIDNFISKSNFDLKILIVNNFPLTMRIQIDMNHVADYLSDKYPNILFILTKKSEIIKDNIAYTNDIIKLDCDLNEISYLSTFCDIIVGRPSGPFTFCVIKDNFIKNKTFITISDNTYDRFYFESEADMLLLTEHTPNALISMLENKIKEYDTKNFS